MVVKKSAKFRDNMTLFSRSTKSADESSSPSIKHSTSIPKSTSLSPLKKAHFCLDVKYLTDFSRPPTPTKNPKSILKQLSPIRPSSPFKSLQQNNSTVATVLTFEDDLPSPTINLKKPDELSSKDGQELMKKIYESHINIKALPRELSIEVIFTTALNLLHTLDLNNPDKQDLYQKMIQTYSTLIALKTFVGNALTYNILTSNASKIFFFIKRDLVIVTKEIQALDNEKDGFLVPENQASTKLLLTKLLPLILKSTDYFVTYSTSENVDYEWFYKFSLEAFKLSIYPKSVITAFTYIFSNPLVFKSLSESEALELLTILNCLALRKYSSSGIGLEILNIISIAIFADNKVKNHLISNLQGWFPFVCTCLVGITPSVRIKSFIIMKEVIRCALKSENDAQFSNEEKNQEFKNNFINVLNSEDISRWGNGKNKLSMLLAHLIEPLIKNEIHIPKPTRFKKLNEYLHIWSLVIRSLGFHFFRWNEWKAWVCAITDKVKDLDLRIQENVFVLKAIIHELNHISTTIVGLSLDNSELYLLRSSASFLEDTLVIFKPFTEINFTYLDKSSNLADFILNSVFFILSCSRAIGMYPSFITPETLEGGPSSYNIWNDYIYPFLSSLVSTGYQNHNMLDALELFCPNKPKPLNATTEYNKMFNLLKSKFSGGESHQSVIDELFKPVYELMGIYKKYDFENPKMIFTMINILSSYSKDSIEDFESIDIAEHVCIGKIFSLFLSSNATITKSSSIYTPLKNCLCSFLSSKSKLLEAIESSQNSGLEQTYDTLISETIKVYVEKNKDQDVFASIWNFFSSVSSLSDKNIPFWFRDVRFGLNDLENPEASILLPYNISVFFVLLSSEVHISDEFSLSMIETLDMHIFPFLDHYKSKGSTDIFAFFLDIFVQVCSRSSLKILTSFFMLSFQHLISNKLSFDFLVKEGSTDKLEFNIISIHSSMLRCWINCVNLIQDNEQNSQLSDKHLLPTIDELSHVMEKIVQNMFSWLKVLGERKNLFSHSAHLSEKYTFFFTKIGKVFIHIFGSELRVDTFTKNNSHYQLLKNPNSDISTRSKVLQQIHVISSVLNSFIPHVSFCGVTSSVDKLKKSECILLLDSWATEPKGFEATQMIGWLRRFFLSIKPEYKEIFERELSSSLGNDYETNKFEILDIYARNAFLIAVRSYQTEDMKHEYGISSFHLHLLFSMQKSLGTEIPFLYAPLCVFANYENSLEKEESKSVMISNFLESFYGKVDKEILLQFMGPSLNCLKIDIQKLVSAQSFEKYIKSTKETAIQQDLISSINTSPLKKSGKELANNILMDESDPNTHSDYNSGSVSTSMVVKKAKISPVIPVDSIKTRLRSATPNSKDNHDSNESTSNINDSGCEIGDNKTQVSEFGRSKKRKHSKINSEKLSSIKTRSKTSRPSSRSTKSDSIIENSLSNSNAIQQNTQDPGSLSLLKDETLDNEKTERDSMSPSNHICSASSSERSKKKRKIMPLTADDNEESFIHKSEMFESSTNSQSNIFVLPDTSNSSSSSLENPDNSESIKVEMAIGYQASTPEEKVCETEDYSITSIVHKSSSPDNGLIFSKSLQQHKSIFASAEDLKEKTQVQQSEIESQKCVLLKLDLDRNTEMIRCLELELEYEQRSGKSHEEANPVIISNLSEQKKKIEQIEMELEKEKKLNEILKARLQNTLEDRNIKKLERLAEELYKEKASRNEILKELETERQSLESEREKVRQLNLELLKEKEVNKQQSEQSKTKLEHLQNTIDKFEQELKNEKERYSELSTVLEGEHEKIQALEANMNEKEDEISKIKLKLETRNKKYTQLKRFHLGKHFCSADKGDISENESDSDAEIQIKSEPLSSSNCSAITFEFNSMNTEISAFNEQVSAELKKYKETGVIPVHSKLSELDGLDDDVDKQLEKELINAVKLIREKRLNRKKLHSLKKKKGTVKISAEITKPSTPAKKTRSSSPKKATNSLSQVKGRKENPTTMSLRSGSTRITRSARSTRSTRRSSKK